MSADGLHVVTTADGVRLKMRRYRPSGEDPFRENAQPVVLFSGILSNMNQFTICTPPERRKAYAGMTLPSPVADWAKDEPGIAEDPLRYYSLAHYLWVKGYDPWLVNSRGTGRGEFTSGRGSLLTTADMIGILDPAPCIDRVIEKTGKAPFIGGHSQGGFISYAYLQGATFDADELRTGLEKGYLPHVTSDPRLAEARNAKIRGYIAIDAGLNPQVPRLVDNRLAWWFFGQKGYFNFNGLSAWVTDSPLTSGFLLASLVRGMLRAPYLKLWWSMDNTEPKVFDFFMRYCFSSTYRRSLGQWGNNAINNCVCEFWKNGIENKDRLKATDPDRGQDGYYYYDQHMPLLTLPMLAVITEAGGVFRTEDELRYLVQAKTPNPLDACHKIPGTMHVDIALGLNAPTTSFPLIGDWLDKVSAATMPAEVAPPPPSPREGLGG